MNKHIFLGVIPATNKARLFNWTHEVWDWSFLFGGLMCEQKVNDEPQVMKYLFMKPYPFRTLNHFTVP